MTNKVGLGGTGQVHDKKIPIVIRIKLLMLHFLNQDQILNQQNLRYMDFRIPMQNLGFSHHNLAYFFFF